MKISYFGHSAFRIETGKSVLMIDPFLTGNPLFKGSPAEAARGATHVLLTHGHDDHLGDTVQICKTTDATLVANFEIATYLAGQGVANYSPGNHGGRISFDDFDCIFTNAWHSSSTFVEGRPVYFGNPAGFVIIAKGESAKTLHVMGDTGISMDMKLVNDLYHPTIGIVPIGDRFTMGPDQAAYACREFFRFDVIIPCHFATFPGFLLPDAQPFVSALGSDGNKVRVMASGDVIDL
jgi:L-ascorbate metabolism protein UlaG (beta-lactamase superfamily)